MELDDTAQKSLRKSSKHPMLQAESSKSSTAKSGHSEMSMSTILPKIADLNSKIEAAVSAKKYLKAHHLGKQRDALKKVIQSMGGNSSKIIQKRMKSEAKESRKEGASIKMKAKVKNPSTIKIEQSLKSDSKESRKPGDSFKMKSKVKNPSTIKIEQSLKVKRNKGGDKNKLLPILNHPISTVDDTIGGLKVDHDQGNVVCAFSVRAKTNKKRENKSKVIPCTVTSQSQGKIEQRNENEKEVSNNNIINAPSARGKEVGSMVSNTVPKKLAMGPNIEVKSKKADPITLGYNDRIMFKPDSPLDEFSPGVEKKINENYSMGSTSNCKANNDNRLKLSRPNLEMEIFSGSGPSTPAVHSSPQEWKCYSPIQKDSVPLSTNLYKDLDETRYTKLDFVGNSPLHHNMYDFDEEPRGSATLSPLELIGTYLDTDEEMENEGENVQMKNEGTEDHWDGLCQQKTVVQDELVDKGVCSGQVNIREDIVDECSEKQLEGFCKQKVRDEIVDEEMGHQSTGTSKQKVVVCNETVDEGTLQESDWPCDKNFIVCDEMEYEDTELQSDGVLEQKDVVCEETMDVDVGTKETPTTNEKVINGAIISHNAMRGGSLKEQPDSVCTVKFFVSDEMSKLILGNRGENIIRLQVETECMIQLRSEKCGANFEKVCNLSGTPESVSQAQSIIERLIAKECGDSNNGRGGADARNYLSQSIRKAPATRKINENLVKKYNVSKPVMKKKAGNSQHRPLISMDTTDNEMDNRNYFEGENYSDSMISNQARNENIVKTFSEAVAKEKAVNSQGPLISLAVTEDDINSQNYLDGENYPHSLIVNESTIQDEENIEEENGRENSVEMDNVDAEEAVVMANIVAEDEEEDGPEKVNKQKSKFECPQCSCKFHSSVKLQIHYDSKHVPKPCVSCGTLVLRKTMDRHMLIHFPKKSFTCPVDECKSVFNRKDNFQAHMNKYHS